MPAAGRDTRQPRATVHRDRGEFDSSPIADAITTRGKELDVERHGRPRPSAPRLSSRARAAGPRRHGLRRRPHRGGHRRRRPGAPSSPRSRSTIFPSLRGRAGSRGAGGCSTMRVRPPRRRRAGRVAPTSASSACGETVGACASPASRRSTMSVPSGAKPDDGDCRHGRGGPRRPAAARRRLGGHARLPARVSPLSRLGAAPRASGGAHPRRGTGVHRRPRAGFPGAVLILTGGEPLTRPDTLELAAEATAAGAPDGAVGGRRLAAHARDLRRDRGGGRAARVVQHPLPRRGAQRRVRVDAGVLRGGTHRPREPACGRRALPAAHERDAVERRRRCRALLELASRAGGGRLGAVLPRSDRSRRRASPTRSCRRTSRSASCAGSTTSSGRRRFPSSRSVHRTSAASRRRRRASARSDGPSGSRSASRRCRAGACRATGSASSRTSATSAGAASCRCRSATCAITGSPSCTGTRRSSRRSATRRDSAVRAGRASTACSAVAAARGRTPRRAIPSPRSRTARTSLPGTGGYPRRPAGRGPRWDRGPVMLPLPFARATRAGRRRPPPRAASGSRACAGSPGCGSAPWARRGPAPQRSGVPPLLLRAARGLRSDEGSASRPARTRLPGGAGRRRRLTPHSVASRTKPALPRRVVRDQ